MASQTLLDAVRLTLQCRSAFHCNSSEPVLQVANSLICDFSNLELYSMSDPNDALILIRAQADDLLRLLLERGCETSKVAEIQKELMLLLDSAKRIAASSLRGPHQAWTPLPATQFRRVE